MIEFNRLQFEHKTSVFNDVIYIYKIHIYHHYKQFVYIYIHKLDAIFKIINQNIISLSIRINKRGRNSPISYDSSKQIVL